MSRLDQPPRDDQSTEDSAQADVSFRDGVPVSARFDDPYYSLQDGVAESAHVFVAGNDLPARFCDGFQIAELGFGTGLNLLVALAAWEAHGLPGRFGFTSFEAFPLSADATQAALAALPVDSARAGELLAAIAAGQSQFALGAADVHVIHGDARKTLPAWSGRADAWFLDGFAPARNPELWQADLMTEIARHSAPRGSFATYTAAGAVRRALSAAGFEVTRVAGYGRKRHMSIGKLP